MPARPKTAHQHFTRGGQITFHNLRMFCQVNKALFKWTAGGVLLLTALISWLVIDTDTWHGARYYAWFVAQSWFRDTSELVTLHWQGQTYQNTLGALRDNALLQSASQTFWWRVQLVFLGCALLGFVVIWIVVRYFQYQGDKQTQDRFIRGIQQASPRQLARLLKQRRDASSFLLDGQRLLRHNFEVQHVLIDGTTGSGKSVAIRKLLRWIRQRGDKAIVYDKGCSFIADFYDPNTDVLLNPFDDRCAAWDVWCDGHEATDFDTMAAALIPQHGDGDPFWVQAARTIFASTAYKMRADRDRSTERLLELMLNDKLESLGRYLEGTESAALVSEKIEKTAISIKSVLAAYIKSLRFLEQLDAQGEDGQPLRQCFSIRDWVKDDTQRGFLFLSSHAQQHASLRPLLSMWLTMACTAMLANKPDPNRRLWVIIDEAPSLHKIPELLDTIAEVRKFGGCFVIGMQSIAQLRQVYGEHGAKALFDLLNTRLFFRAPSFAMAKLASEELGEQEVDISREQYSYGANTIRDGISLGHQTTTRPVVSASEIMQLDDLQCWLRTPGDYPITKLTLRFDPIKARHAPFIQRDYQTSDSMAAIDQLLTWSQVGALDKLDTATRNPLLRRFQHDFSGEQERQAEQSRMHATLSTSSLTSSSAHNKPSAAPGSDDHSAVTSHATDSEAIDESPSIDTPDTTQPSSVVATRDLDNTPTRPSSLMPDDQDATAMITQEEQNILGIGD